MADTEQVQLLLRDLGKLVGMNDLALDEHGRCALLIDDRLEISVTFANGDDHLVMAALVGELPADAPQERYAALLDANFFWRGTNGATLGVDRDTRAVVLLERLPITGLYVGHLEAILGDFVDSGLDWMNRLANHTDEPQGASAAADHSPTQGDVVLRA